MERTPLKEKLQTLEQQAIKFLESKNIKINCTMQQPAMLYPERAKKESLQ